MALIIRTDGSTEKINNPTLEQLQEAVGGRIEYVRIREGLIDGSNYMYCNEEGKNEGLEYNEHATILAEGCIMSWDFIVGNVVVMFEGEDGNLGVLEEE
tara:strand:+ start:470 stop:766 length:297 start_codon:yes stop_codon:yes gene_type:complete